MRDKSDRPFGLIINMRDMSELQKFYEQMSRADRLATVGTFATGLAHEVRNPLGAIKATAQLLAEDLADDERMCGFTQIIVDETNRLDQLVREVQELSQSATPLVSADLNDVVRECLRVALSSGKAPGCDQLTINESYDAALPALPLSPGKIRQALLNVLINALQAAPPAGSICVTTALRPDEPLPAVISVVNKGTSIAPDDLAKVFEPFFTTKDQGTGLGLAITAQIIRHHGGEIHLMNTDEGVAMVISLPLKSPEPDVAF
jgi:signal transduction histidine kinase